ncbi:MAG TPA: hypothetical protein VFG86_17110 [Chloroflexota bacterium]|jgi:hypothetical protein|nr:hypothetical protein [Chloroflexota bacterium]
MMTTAHPVLSSERELRARIDRSVSRAMFDMEFSRILLADPAMVLGDGGCTPQQRRDLRTIRASSLVDFARQAEALFWPGAEQSLHEEVRLAAAGM